MANDSKGLNKKEMILKRIYKNQSKLRLVLNTKCDLTDWKTALICYKKPDGTFGEFPAVVLDVEKGTIFYDFVSTEELDQEGFWFFFPKVIFDDDRETYGRSAKVFVYGRGE